jgi:hypothetical protein
LPITPEEREESEFERIQLVTQMDRDREMIARYRENEQFYINRLIDAARRVGQLDERLIGG